MPVLPTQSPQVVCAGVIVADHLCTPINHLPEAGELVMADGLVLEIGGCASNAAVDLAKMQVPVAVCGCVGHDAFGKFVVETLRDRGVDTAALKRVAGVDTSQTLIVNVRSQDRRFIHCFGANAEFHASDIPLELVNRAKVLYVGGYLLLPALTQEALADVFRSARRRGIQTVLDVAIPGRSSSDGDSFQQLKTLLPETDVFLPNDDEARLLTGRDDPLEQALALHAAGARTTVITMGGRGAILINDRCRLRADVFPVPFVDGSGGGDAFDAGYVCGLLRGADERRCLELASALGASCVRAVGTTPGVFTREECDEFLSNHRLTIQEF